MSDLIKVYVGTNLQAGILVSQLEDAGIKAMSKSRTDSALAAGFGTPDTCQVYINEADIERATEIVEEFKKRNG